jgi:hypothetical protein
MLAHETRRLRARGRRTLMLSLQWAVDSPLLTTRLRWIVRAKPRTRAGRVLPLWPNCRRSSEGG